MQSIKEHNLKANHNLTSISTLSTYLYAIYQRTQSESKSQHDRYCYWCCWICMQSIKEHNLKANHNTKICFMFLKFLYAIYQRTQSESKSQQPRRKAGNERICMQSIKEHNLKANHNSFVFPMDRLISVCNLSKNTIWKQITTQSVLLLALLNLYAIYQRTQSESKSQL